MQRVIVTPRKMDGMHIYGHDFQTDDSNAVQVFGSVVQITEDGNRFLYPVDLIESVIVYDPAKVENPRVAV